MAKGAKFKSTHVPKHRPAPMPKDTVVVLTNHKDGPLVLNKKDTMSFAQDSCNGETPNFRIVSPDEAKKMVKEGNARRRMVASKRLFDVLAHEDKSLIAVFAAAFDLGQYRVTTGIDQTESEKTHNALVEMGRDPHEDKRVIERLIPIMETGGAVSVFDKRWMKALINDYRMLSVRRPDLAMTSLGDLDVIEREFAALPTKGASWPTLADHILAGIERKKSLLSPAFDKTLRDRVRSAEKFVLDDAGAARVGEAIRAYPQQLVKNSAFAIPCYGRMWIEYTINPLNRAAAGGEGYDDGRLCHVGYLLYDGFMYVCARMEDNTPQWAVFSYHLNTPNPPFKEKAFCDKLSMTRDDIDRLLWGREFSQTLDRSTLVGLRANHGVDYIGDKTRPEVLEATIATDFWHELTTDVRNVIGILLALNQPKAVVKEVAIPHRRQFIKGKQTALLGHRVVSFHLGADKNAVRLTSPRMGDPDTRRPAGWHSVIGHYVHDTKGREYRDYGTGCDHGAGDLWVEYAPRRWECLSCGGKRTWRELPNGRGDTSRPVTHHYSVKG